MYNIANMPNQIDIGFTGEKNFRKIEINMAKWMEEMPDGVPSIVHIRPGETASDAYIASTTFADNILTWTISAGDLGSTEGVGTAQIWLEAEENNSIIKRGKSILVATMIHGAINDASESVPAAQTAWMEQMTALKVATENAASAAELATVHEPTVDGETGNWLVWNQESGQYVDTGITSRGQLGAKSIVFELDDVENETGEYTHTTTIEAATNTMKPIAIEVGSPNVFGGNITVTCNNGSITVSCPSVSGESTLKVICEEMAQSPYEPFVTSEEFAVLDGRIGTLANLETTEKGSIVGAINEIVEGGTGGVTDYDDLTDKPSINSVTLSGNKSLSDLGIASASDLSAKYSKPSGGIPSTDLASGVLTSIIDDTAGSGDTDKTFSADKLTSDFSDVLNALSSKYEKPSGGIPSTDLADSYIEEPSSDGTNGQVLTTDGNGGRSWTTVQGGGSVTVDSALSTSSENPVQNKVITNKINDDLAQSKNSFNGIIMDVEGNNILNATVIEGKYAHYSAKTLSILSGVNVVEFDVSNIVRFIYKYTIDTPDNRGLYFVDENNTALNTSYQTLTTAQDIVVPDGAVKCYATADYVDQIFVYEIVPGEKPEEILRSQATYSSTTSGQITYEWTNNNSKLYVHGTRSGASNTKMYNNSSKLPTGMIPGEKYRVVIKSTSGKIIMTFLPYINGSEGTAKNFYNEEIYTIPSNWTGLVIRISVTPNGATVDETIDCPEIYTIPVLKSIRDEINDLKDATNGSETNPLAYIRRDAGLLSVFHTVGCIGDSLASGESAYKQNGTTNLVDLYDFSWGQCLARLTGNTYHNFSAGGLSTRTWLSSQKATDCFDGNHKCDAYYIGLGQNDKNNSIPVGTTADINLSDYSQNADTYCGNMGKIIQKLQEHQPKAPIFVFIDPNPPSGDQTYNNVIDDIVALFDNVWIIDLLTYAGKAMFTESTEIIGSQYRGGHYSAVGYQQIAYVIATYTDWIIRNNLSDFSQVEFIGTNYEWTT